MGDNALKVAEIMKPPTDEGLTNILRTMDDIEVYGIYKWGSKRGRKLAKEECLRRGLITPNFFIWLYQKYFNQ